MPFLFQSTTDLFSSMSWAISRLLRVLTSKRKRRLLRKKFSVESPTLLVYKKDFPSGLQRAKASEEGLATRVFTALVPISTTAISERINEVMMGSGCRVKAMVVPSGLQANPLTVNVPSVSRLATGSFTQSGAGAAAEESVAAESFFGG